METGLINLLCDRLFEVGSDRATERRRLLYKKGRGLSNPVSDRCRGREGVAGIANRWALICAPNNIRMLRQRTDKTRKRVERHYARSSFGENRIQERSGGLLIRGASQQIPMKREHTLAWFGGKTLSRSSLWWEYARSAVAVSPGNSGGFSEQDRKSTRLNSSHSRASRMPSSA